jgi:hypothetical protein
MGILVPGCSLITFRLNYFLHEYPDPSERTGITTILIFRISLVGSYKKTIQYLYFPDPTFFFVLSRFSVHLGAL